MAVGSRGDAEPFCSLAVSLAASGQVRSVELFLQADMKPLVPLDPKIHYHELPFTQMDFYKYAGERKPPQDGADHPNPRVKFLGIVTDIMGQMVLPCYDDVMKVATNSCSEGNRKRQPLNAIVASSLARQLALEVAGQMEQIPAVYLVQLQNSVPTQDYPHYSQHDDCIDALVNNNTTGKDDGSHLESYLELERIQFGFLQQHADTKLSYKDGYKKDRRAWTDFDTDVITALTGHQEKAAAAATIDIWMVNAVSTYIVPAPSDVGPKVLNVGGLADHFIPANVEPPSDLVSFLHGNTTADSPDMKRRFLPICFGYGSMPFGKAELVVQALYESDRPAVLVGSAMMGVRDKIQQLSSSNDSDKDSSKLVEWTKKNIHCVTSVPYGWLLPRCSMMFSHGGAGVVHATLRAGIPSVISPLMGDQFFFADYLEAKGWGVKASESLGALSKEDILKSIAKAEGCQEACRILGGEMVKGEPAGSNSNKFGPGILTEAIVSQYFAIGSK